MPLSSLIQLIAACVGIVGSLFFAIGVMRQTVEAMAKLSGTYFDWNPHMPPALAAQKADYVFGGGLILVAFVLQLASFFVPVSAEVLSVEQSLFAPWVAAASTLVVFVLLRIAAKCLARYFESQINAWLKRKLEAGM